MIFYAAAIISSLISIYLITGKWFNNVYRILFGALSSILISLLVLFGLEFKINAYIPEVERRVIIYAVDVSASTGIEMDNIKEQIKTGSQEYNVEIIPFSNSLRGPEGEQVTGLIGSMEDLFSYINMEYTDDKVAGLVVITDGNETERIRELKDEIPLRGEYPHNIIYLKNYKESTDFDKSVVFIDVPRFMPRYKKEKITFAVNISGTRLHAVPVELKLDGKNLGSVLVNINDGYGEGEFDLIIKATGNFLLEASIAHDSREKHLTNNRDFALVEGIMKGFKVLHISGHPSTNTAFIRRGLQNLPGVDMISFYILRLRQQLTNVPNSELSLIPFPTDQLFRKDLALFDLIIINDFSLSKWLNPLYINNIIRFVKSGGGLLFMGGENSFMAKDFFTTHFDDILPLAPSAMRSWRDNVKYKLEPLDICDLTSLSLLNRLKGITFKGINKIKLKENANLFCRASDGSPLVAGLKAGKGSVITVMTDSIWRASYYGDIKNETLLKSFVRYLLGISTMPVKIDSGNIAFDKKFLPEKFKDIRAELSFPDPLGGVSHKKIVTPGSPYTLQKGDSRLIDVKILYKDNPLDKYKLVNFNEKRDNEHSLVPSGKDFLIDIADRGNGIFLEVTNRELKDVDKSLNFREPVLLSENKLSAIPIYRHKGILFLFLLIAVASFFVKSRFYD